MPAFPRPRGLFLVLLLTGCANTPTHVAGTPAHPAPPVMIAQADTGSPALPDAEDDAHDPFERFNRSVFTFNDRLDRYVAKPVARAYDKVLPNGVRRGISNFFNNLLQPTVVFNDLLQAKFGQTAADSGRFLVNTTLGIAGIFDVASHFGLEPHDEDLGQTLAVWGVPDGPYLVWPVFGPRSGRDSVGLVGDWYTDPVTYVSNSTVRWSVRGVNYTNRRAELLGASSILEQAAGEDPYVFVREAYRQRRQNLIYDGNPPPPKFD